MTTRLYKVVLTEARVQVYKMYSATLQTTMDSHNTLFGSIRYTQLKN